MYKNSLRYFDPSSCFNITGSSIFRLYLFFLSFFRHLSSIWSCERWIWMMLLIYCLFCILYCFCRTLWTVCYWNYICWKLHHRCLINTLHTQLNPRFFCLISPEVYWDPRFLFFVSHYFTVTCVLRNWFINHSNIRFVFCNVFTS